LQPRLSSEALHAGGTLGAVVAVPNGPESLVPLEWQYRLEQFGLAYPPLGLAESKATVFTPLTWFV